LLPSMNFRGRTIILIGLCLGAVFLSIASTSHDLQSTPYNPDAGTTLGELTEEHEANGPEGVLGTPMQRLPVAGICAAIAVLLASRMLTDTKPARNLSGASCAKNE